jgi:hypothetical protein
MWKDREQYRCDTHIGSYSRVPRALATGVQRRVREAQHLHLVLKLRMSEAMPSRTSYA